jgi:hypothetical protein
MPSIIVENNVHFSMKEDKDEVHHISDKYICFSMHIGSPAHKPAFVRAMSVGSQSDLDIIMPKTFLHC